MNRKMIFSLCLSLMMSLFTMPAFGQNQTVTGTVLDELGEPVIGATVMVNGDKTKATITDLDGNYKLAVPAGAKVTITYIGYMPMTVKPGGTVKLQEDRQSLEEVVVVGYGSQKKAHLTGSVATVDMNDVQDLAAEFHSFYNSNRVISEDKDLMRARLALVFAIKIVLKNALDILAVSAPERM